MEHTPPTTTSESSLPLEKESSNTNQDTTNDPSIASTGAWEVTDGEADLLPADTATEESPDICEAISSEANGTGSNSSDKQKTDITSRAEVENRPPPPGAAGQTPGPSCTSSPGEHKCCLTPPEESAITPGESQARHSVNNHHQPATKDHSRATDRDSDFSDDDDFSRHEIIPPQNYLQLHQPRDRRQRNLNRRQRKKREQQQGLARFQPPGWNSRGFQHVQPQHFSPAPPQMQFFPQFGGSAMGSLAAQCGDVILNLGGAIMQMNRKQQLEGGTSSNGYNNYYNPGDYNDNSGSGGRFQRGRGAVRRSHPRRGSSNNNRGQGNHQRGNSNRGRGRSRANRSRGRNNGNRGSKQQRGGQRRGGGRGY